MTPDWLKDPPQITPEVQAIRASHLSRQINAVPLAQQRTGEEPV